MTRPIPSTRREVVWHNPSLLVLASLAREPKYGSAIIRDVHGSIGVLIFPATISVTMVRLEMMGFIRPVPSESKRLRKYELTPRGSALLDDLVAGMGAFVIEHARRTRGTV